MAKSLNVQIVDSSRTMITMLRIPGSVTCRKRWRAEAPSTAAASYNSPGIAFMPEAHYGRSTCWLTCLTIDPALFGASRETVRLALERENVEARPVWNAAIDKYPGAIIRCRGTADVIDAVNFAGKHNLLIAVRGGGHSAVGRTRHKNGLHFQLALDATQQVRHRHRLSERPDAPQPQPLGWRG